MKTFVRKIFVLALLISVLALGLFLAGCGCSSNGNAPQDEIKLPGTPYSRGPSGPPVIGEPTSPMPE